MTSIFFQTNNTTYHVRIDRAFVGTQDGGPLRKDNPPLVLLHGFTGSVENWRPLIEQLAPLNRTVIAIDILGHGRSSAPLDPTRYRMELVAADIAETLNTQLGFSQIDLLGYSMGGRLALSIACDYPQLINRLILESASPGLETMEERNARKTSDDALADWIEQNGIPAFVDRWEAVPLFDSQKVLPESVRARLRNQRLHNRTHGLANSLRGMGTGVQPPFWVCLAQLTLPVHLIVGELDTKFCRIADEMMEKLPNAKLTVVENAGHTVHLERPEMFTKLTNDALRKN